MLCIFLQNSYCMILSTFIIYIASFQLAGERNIETQELTVKVRNIKVIYYDRGLRNFQNILVQFSDPHPSGTFDTGFHCFNPHFTKKDFDVSLKLPKNFRPIPIRKFYDFILKIFLLNSVVGKNGGVIRPSIHMSLHTFGHF